jgi:D-beta-D-heptose 7-phosphate kinase/D-beta-D-heptose 1-phosphate adenosyltransferase
LQNIQGKIRTSEELGLILNEITPSEGSVVFTNGCFDLLHRGHVEYLLRAAELGRVLVVGLNSDDSVGRLKGPGRPLQSQDDRAVVLASQAAVDYVVIFDEDTPYRLIDELKPDVLVKGGDWKPEDVVGGDLVAARGGRVEIIPYLEGRSTSALIERIKSSL